MKNIKPDITILQTFLTLQSERDLVTQPQDSTNSESLSKGQLNIILATKIIIITFGLLLLGFTCFNIKNYLIVKKRYRIYNDLFFYINVVVILIFTCIQAYLIPNEQFCTYKWLVVAYIPSLGNLNLGVCQASTLTSLLIQVKQLFKLKKDTDSSGIDAISLE